MKKIGIYGGTFSPPHNGHINAAKKFIDELALDELIIIPSNIPPHKAIDENDKPRHRLNMAKLAFEGLKSTTVSDWEIAQNDISYTANTLEHFSEQGELYFLCGTDMFMSIESWYRPDIIFKKAKVVLALRDDTPSEECLSMKEYYLRKYSAEIHILTNSVIELSSTEIRTAVSRGQDVSWAIPNDVAEYIKNNGLYKTVGKANLEALKAKVRSRESKKRFEHTLSVEKEAIALADIFGLSEEDKTELRKAALLHDITKEYTPEEHYKLSNKYNCNLSQDDISSPAILHSITGALVAKYEFPDFTSETVASAIAAHTTGKPDMTVIDKLLFLADYIEPTRTHSSCISVRNEFYNKISASNNQNKFLDSVILEITEKTIEHLENKGLPIHPLTLETKDALQKDKKG